MKCILKFQGVNNNSKKTERKTLLQTFNIDSWKWSGKLFDYYYKYDFNYVVPPLIFNFDFIGIN